MVAIKALYDEYNQLSLEAKAFQDKYTGDEVAPREDLNTMLAKAVRMDEIKAELATAAEQKSLSDRVQKHMDFSRTGTGHAPLSVGENPAASDGEQKDGWITIQHEGKAFPLYHAKHLETRPDLKASLTPEYKRVFEQYVRGNERDMDPSDRRILAQGKALSESSNTGGGFAVPVDFIPELIRRRPGAPIFSQRARHITTNRDQVLAPRIAANTGTYPTMYASAVTGSWVSENPTASSAQVAPVFEQVAITVNTAKLETIISRNLVSDAAFNIGTYLTDEFGDAANLMKDQAFLIGTGVSQPQGIVTSGDITNLTSKTAATLSPDDFKELKYKVALQYQSGAMYFMSLDALRVAREMKDGNGNYIWSPGFNHGVDGGVPDTIEGSPYAVSDFLDTAGATNKQPVFFGDPKFYWVIDRLEMSIQVLNELYAESNQIAYLAFFRCGGNVVLPQAFRVMKLG